MRLSDQFLSGRTVVAADGLAIGEVTALFISSANWQVESLQIRVRREVAERAGATKRFFRTPSMEIPVRLIQSVGDAIVLRVKVNELRQEASEEEPSMRSPGIRELDETQPTRH